MLEEASVATTIRLYPGCTKVYVLSLMLLVEISNVQLAEASRQVVPFVTMK